MLLCECPENASYYQLLIRKFRVKFLFKKAMNQRGCRKNEIMDGELRGCAGVTIVGHSFYIGGGGGGGGIFPADWFSFLFSKNAIISEALLTTFIIVPFLSTIKWVG